MTTTTALRPGYVTRQALDALPRGAVITATTQSGVERGYLKGQGDWTALDFGKIPTGWLLTALGAAQAILITSR